VNWILLSITVLLGMVSIALAVLIVLYILAQRRHKKLYDALLQEHIDDMRKVGDLKQQRDKLNTERDILSREVRKSENAIASYVGDIQQYLAQNADLREALQEAQAEIKALQMNTIEVQEVAPVPKRTTRKKAGA
jgi:chromosome segregation ATPase